MAFDWKEFLELARFLQAQLQAKANLPQEAAYRCAIGRAYYAAYGYAHKYASTWLGFKGKTKPEEKSQDHGALKAFSKSKRRWKIGEYLDSLRNWRNMRKIQEKLTSPWSW